MGNAKRIRKKYVTPPHPWQAKRIEKERELKQTYGLQSKEEIWKMESILKTFSRNIKTLIATRGAQAELEKKQIMGRISRIGLLPASARLEDVLDLRVENILDRRLQTLVYRKGLARSMSQARQFITHQHIMVGGQTITFPSYIVKADEENAISFNPSSELAKADHPERTPITKKVKPRPAPKEERRGRR